MQIEISYKTQKTIKIEVDDKYKKMLDNDEAWGCLVEPLSDTIVNKIRQIENNKNIYDNNVLEVWDVETDSLIYCNT